MAIPPGTRLEKLKGDLVGFYSIWVNDQFRIIFKLEARNRGEPGSDPNP